MTIKKLGLYWTIYSGEKPVVSCASFEAAVAIAEQVLYGT